MLSTLFLIIIVIIVGLLTSLVFQFNYLGYNSQPISYSSRSNQYDVVMSDKFEHIIWFLQISDIHLSIFIDHSRLVDFEYFCDKVIETINPSVVLATGDLTDARTDNLLGSSQHLKEWIWYKNALVKNNIANRTVWLDIRGNHDAFNVFSWQSSNNYYREYSHKGPKNKGHFSYTLTKENDVYNFFGIDACLEPSPKRPFNFIGYLKDSDIVSIKNLIQKSPLSNMSIFFGHYPTSSIINAGKELRPLVTGPYLCGHFHTLLGLVHKMYASQANGYLEAELADWSSQRKFRVAAVDFGLFSFVDVKLNQWPIVLITNPKPSLYLMEKFEPTQRITSSTHLRALVFSPYPIEFVKFSIDNDNWQDMKLSSSNFYTHSWDPSKYLSGLHSISVKAQDKMGNKQTFSHQFSLDNSKPSFSLGGLIALRINTRAFVQTVYCTFILISIIPITTMRILFIFNKGSVLKAKSEINFAYKCCFMLFLLASIDKFFYPLLFIPIYSLFGPWFIGEIIDGHGGIVFSWAIWIKGTWIPVAFTYILGTLQLILFHLNIVACLSHIVYCQYQQLSNKTLPNKSILKYLRHLYFVLILVCDIFTIYCFWMAYGFKSFILGFNHTVFLMIYTYLWISTFKLTPKLFPNCLKITN